MDVVSPDLEIIDGISYRINPGDDYNALKNAETTPYVEFGDDKEIECGGEIVNDDENEAEVELLDDGYYLLQVHIPREFHSIIVGPKGSTRQRIEIETKTYIDVPHKNEKGNTIEIKGKSRTGVLAAYRRIKIAVGSVRSKIPCSHFISIPMLNEEIFRNFERFREEVLNTCGDCPGISKQLFQNPARLHLTAGVMFLADTEEIDVAIETMISSKADVVDPIFQGRSLKVRVRGIELMNDDPSEVRVLYAKVEDPSNGFLQEVMDKMVDYFADAGLMEKERSSVKLHMTLMSSAFLFKKELNEKTAPKTRKKTYFDASRIMELYKDFDFGFVEVDSLHLSQRHTKIDNGYYLSSCKLTFF